MSWPSASSPTSLSTDVPKLYNHEEVVESGNLAGPRLQNHRTACTQPLKCPGSNCDDLSPYSALLVVARGPQRPCLEIPQLHDVII
ncbi:MAG: hypothetical protein U0930_10455 [Pirellulales bacterium]